MNRYLAIAAAAVAIVVGVVLFRTFTIKPPVPLSTGTPPPSVNSLDVAKHLAQAVRFQTVSYGGGAHEAEKFAALEQMRTWLEATYPNFHRVATREVMDHSLLFTWKGKNPSLPPILLMAHQDVVPVVPGTEHDWSHPPFAGDIAGGFVWGRGAIDDKGSLICILEAAERLAAQHFTPARTILFAFGQDEEVGGGKGNKRMAAELGRRGVHFAWVLDEGGAIMDEPFPGVQQPMAVIAVAEKGYLSLELTAHGQGGHSSRPTRDLAIGRLSRAVLNVVDHPFSSGLDDIQRDKLSAMAPYMPLGQRLLLANLWLSGPLVARVMDSVPDSAARLHTTISPTMLSAGVKDNVLPPEAHATVNFRLHQRDTIEEAIDHVKKAINDPKVEVRALTETQSEASKVADLNGPHGQFLVRLVQESFNGIPVAPDVTTGATDSRHYLPIADEVFRLDVFHFGPDDLGRVHGTNERLAVGDLGPAVGFYLRLMQEVK
jgi:carboxypeptidase PM20D1